jgi:hypothetical protein
MLNRGLNIDTGIKILYIVYRQVLVSASGVGREFFKADSSQIPPKINQGSLVVLDFS